MTLEIRGLNISDSRDIRDQVNKLCFGYGICEVDIISNGYYEYLSDVLISTPNILINNNIIYIYKDKGSGVDLSNYRFIDIRIKM